MKNKQEKSDPSIVAKRPAKKPPPPLQVFISYKLKDDAATKAIKEILEKIGGDRIKVFVSGDEEPGIQWRENVMRKLANAHILLFLYTDPESHWDWCLYETGYFDARQKPRELKRHLYVLHRREDPPSGPFLGLTTVPIDFDLKTVPIDASGDRMTRSCSNS